MGKHNGKARKPKGTSSVGASLVNRARRDGRNGGAAAYLHTTDVAPTKNMQSVIENNDLDEMMQMVRGTPFSVDTVVQPRPGVTRQRTQLRATRPARLPSVHLQRVVTPPLCPRHPSTGLASRARLHR